MELKCHLVTNGLYCGDSTGYEDPRPRELEAGKNDRFCYYKLTPKKKKRE
jgi:hypothetical protein